jgi:hypothetical protein
MKKLLDRLARATAVVALEFGLMAPAVAAGSLPQASLVGGNQYCNSLGNGSCQSYTPAGPAAVTGVETIDADTNLASGAQPQNVLIPVSALGLANNRLVGGDFNTNIAQRLSTTKGIASLASLTPTAAVVSADDWWVYSASGTTTTTIASGSTEILPALGTTKALRFARTTSTTGSQQCVGQTLDQNQSTPLIGANAVFSFYELNGAGQSAVGGAFTAEISYSSGSAAAGTQATLGYAGSQGSKYAIGTNAATFGTGGPTNQTAAVPVLGSGTTGTIGANGFATIPGSTTWARYVIAAPIPTTIPGTTTAVTDVSIEICFTPAGTGASTTDWIELQGLQLEAKPSTVTQNLPNGVITPSGFERRPTAVEAQIDYSYWYYNFENQGIISAVANCVDQSTTVAQCNIVFPVPMRIVPAVATTSGFQIFTTTGYSAVNACTLAVDGTYSVVPSNTNTVMQCTATTVPAAGTANILTTLGTTSSTGIIVASALP